MHRSFNMDEHLTDEQHWLPVFLFVSQVWGFMFELSRSKLHKTGDLQVGNWHVNCQHSSCDYDNDNDDNDGDNSTNNNNNNNNNNDDNSTWVLALLKPVARRLTSTTVARCRDVVLHLILSISDGCTWTWSKLHVDMISSSRLPSLIFTNLRLVLAIFTNFHQS